MLQKLHDHIERFVWMVDKDVFRADRGETIPAIVFYPLGKAGGKRREQEVRPVRRDQFANVGKRYHPIEHNDVLRTRAGLLHHKIA